MAKSVKKLYKSKTFWTAIATIAGGLGMYFAGEQSLQDLIISGVGAIFLVLRYVTDSPVEL